VEEMAGLYVRDIKKIQRSGPYQIGGWCLGGTIAYEIAQQLIAAGETVSLLALFDEKPNFNRVSGALSDADLEHLERQQIRRRLRYLFPPKIKISGIRPQREFALCEEEQLDLVVNTYKKLGALPRDITLQQYRRYLRVVASNVGAKQRYEYKPCRCRITLFRSALTLDTDRLFLGIDETYGWQRVSQNGIDVHSLPIEHDAFLTVGHHVATLASALQPYLT
jgi:thioesterase domain-containing protein